MAVQLWQELNLKKTLSLPSSIPVVDASPPDLVLTLAYSERLTGPTSDNLGSQDSASLNLKLPSGVQKVYLESIDLTLVISAIREDDASKDEMDFDWSFSNSFEPNLMLDGNEYNTCSFGDGADGNRAASSQDIDGHQELSIQRAHRSNPREITMRDPEKSSQATTTLSDHSQKVFSSLSDCSRNSVLATSAKNDCDNSTIASSRNAWLQHCSGLVDAALRKTLGGDDAYLTSGVRALNDMKIPTLATIAPILFNATYQRVSTCHPAQNIGSGVMASNQGF